MQLTKTQAQIFNDIETTTNNFLILGKPGVGKSVLINALVNEGKKNYTVAAPTGIAAINVSGKTLHSIFRIPVIDNGSIPIDFPLPDHEDVPNLYKLSTLIIDEISMVRADVLDYIDRVLKMFRNNNLPFGGIQVILVGDFCQLPPVVNPFTRKELKATGYQSEFAFSAKAFDLSYFKVHVLTEVLRQKDDHYFMDILNAARFGNVSPAMIKDLNALVGVPKPDTITLAGTNKQADEINSNEMARLTTPARSYLAEADGDWPENLWPLPAVIRLKVGAQVMVRKNRANINNGPDADDTIITEKDLVNGTIATITDTDGKDFLKLNTGHSVYRQTYKRTRKVPVLESWMLQVYATFNQMPVTPAWAISMHKSQGQSFDRVTIDPSRIFSDGQLYVALSRARTMKGLTLTRPVTAEKFTVNRFVQAFYNAL